MCDQSAFAAALLEPEQPCPAGLRSHVGGDPSARFAVYRNNVAVSLVDALADSFPVTLALVGEAFFRLMARNFIYKHPPKDRLLAFYGEQFPDFMADFPPAASVPYLADVARLEICWIRAYHAADAMPISIDDLWKACAVPALLPKLRLTLHPSLQTLSSSHAIVSLWAAHQGLTDIGDIDTNQPESALILRIGLQVYVYRLEPDKAAFVDQLLAGNDLETAIAASQIVNPSFHPTQALTALIQGQAIIALGSS